MKRQTEAEWTAERSTSYLKFLLIELERERVNHGRDNSARIDRVKALIATRSGS